MLKEMRRKEAGRSAQALGRRDEAARLEGDGEENAGLLLQPSGPAPTTPFPEPSGIFPSAGGSARPAWLQARLSALRSKEELCRALSSQGAGNSPQCPAKGLVGTAARKMPINPEGFKDWGAEFGRGAPPGHPAGGGEVALAGRPLVTHTTCPSCGPRPLQNEVSFRAPEGIPQP